MLQPAKTVDRQPESRIDISASRRAFVDTFGNNAVGAAVLAAAEGDFTEASSQSITDIDILNFALNLEYLESTYYLTALTGQGLSPSDIGPDPGTVTGGTQVNFQVPVVKAFACEIAIQEKTHVEFLRGALGSAAVSRPDLDIGHAFDVFGQAAFRSNFNPYANDTNFLLGSYVFEDVGVTAYRGALSLLSNRAYIGPASGILVAETYHSAIVRTSLFAMQNQQISNITQAIASLRSALANQGDPDADDHGIGTLASPHVTDPDSDAIAFTRSTSQVLAIVYGNPLAIGEGGAFFPSGMNGAIR